MATKTRNRMKRTRVMPHPSVSCFRAFVAQYRFWGSWETLEPKPQIPSPEQAPSTKSQFTNKHQCSNDPNSSSLYCKRAGSSSSRRCLSLQSWSWGRHVSGNRRWMPPTATRESGSSRDSICVICGSFFPYQHFAISPFPLVLIGCGATGRVWLGRGPPRF